MDKEQTVDPFSFNLMIQLLKRGYLDLADAEEIAARLDDEGQEEAAHAARMAPIEADLMPHPADERRQVVVQLVPRAKNGPDGGNEQR